MQWQHIGRSASVFGRPSVEVSADYLVGKTKRNRNAKMLLPLRGDFDQQPSCPSYDMQLECFLPLLQSFAHGWIFSPTLQVKDHENSSELNLWSLDSQGPYETGWDASYGEPLKSAPASPTVAAATLALPAKSAWRLSESRNRTSMPCTEHFKSSRCSNSSAGARTKREYYGRML